MPLSESEKELLLSASLDGALSADEQAMLDQWFQEDPSALRQQEELLETRNQLRAALAPLRHSKLDAGFADRVVAAAIEQAQTEKLAATHPLVRLADQPGDVASRSSGRRDSVLIWRWGAAAAALAASWLLVVYLAGRPGGPGAVPQELAQNDGGEQPATRATSDQLAADEPAGPEVERVPAELRDRDGASSSVPPSALAVDPQTLDGAGRQAEAAGVDRTGVEPPVVAPPGTIAEAAPMVPAPVPTEATDDATPQRVPLVAVLVVAVELTPQGRDSQAVIEALRAADIKLGPAALVEEKVVAQLRQSQVIAAAEGNRAAQLYYIEAPAKQLDRFLLRLMADKDSFASFGMSIADSPGLLASVADWQEFDPTALRHADMSGLARDLVLADGAPLAIHQGPAFVPMPRELGTAGLLTPLDGDTSSGEDVNAQILLLIR